MDTPLLCKYCGRFSPGPCRSQREHADCIIHVAGAFGKTVSDGGSTDYYKLPEGATELLDLIEHKQMNFNVGNIFKAAYRLGEKAGNDLSYDLKKIIFFAERELARSSAKSKDRS
jgi:hypothetical protein